MKESKNPCRSTEVRPARRTHEPSRRAVSRKGPFRSSNPGQKVKNPHHGDETTYRPWVVLLCWFARKKNAVSINHGIHGIHRRRAQILSGYITVSSVCSVCSVVLWSLGWKTVDSPCFNWEEIDCGIGATIRLQQITPRSLASRAQEPDSDPLLWYRTRSPMRGNYWGY